METFYQGQQGQQHMRVSSAGGQSGQHSGHQMNTMDDTHMVGGDSLDDIIRDNHNELQRRRSIPQPYSGQLGQDAQDRRLSMMEFGASDDSYRNYGFPNPPMAADFSNMGGNMSMPGPMDDFSSQDVMQMPAATNYAPLSSDMMGNMMPATFANMNMSPMGHDTGGMGMFDQSPMGTHFPPDSLNTAGQDFSMDLTTEDEPVNATTGNPVHTLDLDAADNDMMGAAQTFPSDENAPAAQPSQTLKQEQSDSNIADRQPTLSREISNNSVQSPARPLDTPKTTTSQTTASAATTPGGPGTPRVDPKKKTVYSKSGFDMLRALWYVATRKNPDIHLGAVDMSCAFVVCDVTLNDCPIIYVSDNFQNLTGYSRHEIVGQNCRFLQSPSGKVEAGSKREFVDDAAVYNLKRKIAEGKEVQQSLINYRKGGKPFLNLLTMIPIPWDNQDEVRFFVGFQIDLVECPDAISSGQEIGGVKVNYKHNDIGQYIWTPPTTGQIEPDNGQTLGVDDVSTLLQQFNPKGTGSDWHKQSWDKMLLENTDDVVHVLSLKGLFLYLSPSCKRVLEYDAAELVGNSLSTACHPSDIVPVTRELKDTTIGNPVNIVFRIRRKQSGYTWFESHGSLFVEQGKGRKCIILVGRKRPVFTLSRRDLEANGGIGDSELWTKISTSGMFLFVSSNIRSLLDLQPETLVGTSIQELMRKESRAEFGRSIEKARRGKIVTCKHEVHNRRGQVLQAQTILYPGDAADGQKPTFLLAQTKLIKASSRTIAPATTSPGSVASVSPSTVATPASHANNGMEAPGAGPATPVGGPFMPGSLDAALATDDNIFDELRTTKCSSWQFELRQMEKVNRILAEELGGLLSNKKKRKRRKGVGNLVRDCANCHTRNTPEWRRGPSGQRDLCNSCGLRWAKQTGRVSPRNSSRGGNGDTASKQSNSPVHSSPPQREVSSDTLRGQPADGDANAGSQGTPGGTPSKGYSSMPPPSQPLLEGGSGVDITPIREERETSQS